MIGINIDDVYDFELENKLKRLPQPRPKDRVARIVIPSFHDITQAVEAVRITQSYADIMVQLQDSYGERDLTDFDYDKKVDTLYERFKNDCRLWEIGNEVNGSWCSSNIVDRVKRSWLKMPTDHKAVLTLFWEPNMISWYKANPIQTDYVFISFYPGSYSDIATVNFGVLTARILAINPNAKVGIGEYGTEEWETSVSWREKIAIRKQIEAIKVDHPAWVGAGFFWDGQLEGWG